MKKMIKKLMERVLRSEEGFTLVELIIVIAILAIISSIAIPNILNAVDNSRRTTDVTNAKIIADAVATTKAMNDTYANVNGSFTLTATGFSDGNSTTNTAFETALFNAINNTGIELKFKGHDSVDTAKNFKVTVSSNSIVVYATGDTTDVQIYPMTSSSIYENK